MKLRKFLIYALIFVLLLSPILSVSAYASGDDSDDGVSVCANFYPIYYDDCTWGFTGWETLGAAMAYYGAGYSYSSCTPFTYNGNTYNHYYTFTDGSRCYFGVLAQ